MPRFAPQRYEQILQKMLARVVTRSELSDVSDTSPVKHILAACARALDELNYQASLILTVFSIDTATGADLDARAQDIQPALLTRLPAAPAVGSVVFSRSVVSGTVAIQIGTQVKTASGVVFTTTAAGSITPTSTPQISGHTTGQDSLPVAVVASVAGSAGNVAGNTLVSFVQKPVGVNTVTNPAACTQGSDQESDDAFRQRLKNYVAGLARSTVQALQSAVLGAQDPNSGATILFASVYENPTVPGYVTVYIDDGTGSAETVSTATNEDVTAGLAGPPPNHAVGGETNLFLQNKPINTTDAITLTSSSRGTLVEGTQYTLNAASGLLIFSPALAAAEQVTASYTYYTGLVALAQKIIDGDPNNPTDYPGVRAAGVQVLALTPQVVLITVNAILTIADGFDAGTVQANVQSAILAYINGLGISGDVLLASLFQTVMNVAGVNNVVINSPTSDTLILDSQLARTTQSNVTIT